MFFILLFTLINSQIDGSLNSFFFMTHYNKRVQLHKPDKYLLENKITKLFRRFIKAKEEKGWYYVYFYPQNISAAFDLLRINRKNEIIKSTYTLFLTKKQLSQIANISLVKRINPNEKFHEENILINETNHFIVTALPQFQLQPHTNYKIEMRYRSGSYIIRIDEDNLKKKKSIINELSKIPEIKFIIAYKKPTTKNSIGTGFTQKNSFTFSTTGEKILTSNRYLNENGLSGEGQVVTVMDTPLDFYHSMFYDENVPLELNRFMPNHRKIVYYGFSGTIEDLEKTIVQSEHGTHVCGTVSGKNMCKNDKFGLSNFNGNAPESKILFAGSYDDVDPDSLGELMNKHGSYISSNSWGSTGYDSFENYMYGTVAYESPKNVFIYAAGNEYELLNGNFSVCDPGGSKNVLTVGAIDDFYADEQRTFLMRSLNRPDFTITFNDTVMSSFDIYFQGNFETQKIGIIDMSKGEQCEAIKENQITLLYGDYSNWIFNCIFRRGTQCLYTTEKEKLKELYENIKGTIYFQRIFDIDENKKKIRRASYSSTGPANMGILKPDVMAPGTKIISAKSNKNSNYSHGCLDELSNDYILMDGTSMATPNIAGAMALVHQYFNSGRWIEKVNLNGATSRALMINSCKHPFDSKMPDILYGHGVVDLSAILPIKNEFGVQLTKNNNNNIVSENGHVVAKLKVNPKLSKNKLQITMSYLDPMLDMESFIPIVRDLDLIVVSPSKKIFIGDHLDSKDTQHISTNEKIIINEDEIEEGEYLIHVYGGAFVDSLNSNEKQEFSVVASGPIENGYLDFVESNQCPCDKCDKNRPGFCSCDSNDKTLGQICQVNIEEIKDINATFDVGPLEIKRVRFTQNNDKIISKVISKSESPGKGINIWISENCHLSLGEYEIINAFEFNFEILNELSFNSSQVCVAIFNNNDRFATYGIEVVTEDNPNKDDGDDKDKDNDKKKEDKVAFILMIFIAVNSVILVIFIVIIIVLCNKLRMCNKGENYEKAF